MKLQAVLKLTPEQVQALPPTQVRIRELEQDNARLRTENEALRVQVQQLTSVGRLRGPNQDGSSDLREQEVHPVEKKRRRSVDEGPSTSHLASTAFLA